MSVHVRRAIKGDAQSLLELRRTVFAETSYMLWEAEEFVATAKNEEDFIAWLSSRQNSCLLVAEEDGQLLGFLGVTGGERRRNKHSALLFLGVLRAHWSRGIASHLLKEVVAWAPTAGLVRLELTVHKSNERAVRLYERFGFVSEGTSRSSLRVDGAFIDELLMSRIGEA